MRLPEKRHVYVIGVPGELLVKVGIAKDVEARRRGLSREAKRQLTIFYSVKVRDIFSRRTEIIAHRFLEKYQHGAEWFSCGPAVAAIAAWRAARYDARTNGSYEQERVNFAFQRVRRLEWELVEARRRLAELMIHCDVKPRVRMKARIAQ